MHSYGPLCTEFYDADKPAAPADAVEYYVRRARDAGGPVLEPMCGSGRFLLPLLRAGIDVEGVDAAPAMLEACRRRAALEHLRPVLYLQTLEALALPRRYRMAFVPSGSMGLLAESALHSALGRIRRHLEPGANLLLELIRPVEQEAVAGEFEPRVVQIDSETSITYTCRANLASDGASITYDGRYEKRRGTATVEVETESLMLNLHRPERFVEMLVACGFHRASILSSSEYASLACSGCALIEARTAV